MGLNVAFSNLEKHGRLGNQLWQIAACIGLAKDLGSRPVIPAGWSYRPFFSLPQEWYEEDPEAIEASHLCKQMGKAAYYLQDTRLWENAVEDVRCAFFPSEEAKDILYPLVGEYLDILSGPVLSVHVRRGDNLTNAPGSINCLPASYYWRAINEIGGECNSVAVFSDDIEWCKDEFSLDIDDAFHRVSYFEGTPRPKENGPDYEDAPVTDWIDLQLMSFCDRHVLSNSSYSWWGYYLSDSKHVPACPSYWFGKSLSRQGFSTESFIPKNWSMIEVADPNPLMELTC